MKFMSTGYYTNGDLLLKFQERGSSMLHRNKRKIDSEKG
jgi:hypothetical protein